MAGGRGHRILQANLNHCGTAQELWLHSLARLEIGLAMVSEPYRVRQGELSSACGLVTILRREESPFENSSVFLVNPFEN